MPRTRTTKKLAQRIDLNYFKRSSALRRWRTWLLAGLPALAVVWLVWLAVRRDNTVYSSGRLSIAHAVLNADCAACHVREAGHFKAAAKDIACLACHDGPMHHEGQMFTPTCASCHVDHRGLVRLAATSDTSCAQCHAELYTSAVPPRFENASSFSANHPEFAALRKKHPDPGAIALNHAVHLKKDLRGPDGNPVQLTCFDCHRTVSSSSQPWTYGQAEFRPAGLKSKPEEHRSASQSQARHTSTVAARRMELVKYEKTCAACHLLQFDKRFNESVPHGKDFRDLYQFIAQKFQQYIAKHPSELRVVRESDRNLAGKTLQLPLRVLAPSQWVEERTKEAEDLLLRKTCKQCHSIHYPFPTYTGVTRDGKTIPESLRVPEVADPKIPTRWMPHANFSHSAHQMLTCTSCHAATTSTETSDVLMPGIATCRTCHNQSANGAESRCFLCHTYHDWSREKPVRGRFRLRELTGDRSPKPGEQKVAIE